MSKRGKYPPEFKREAVELTSDERGHYQSDRKGSGYRCQYAKPLSPGTGTNGTKAFQSQSKAQTRLTVCIWEIKVFKHVNFRYIPQLLVRRVPCSLGENYACTPLFTSHYIS